MNFAIRYLIFFAFLSMIFSEPVKNIWFTEKFFYGFNLKMERINPEDDSSSLKEKNNNYHFKMYFDDVDPGYSNLLPCSINGTEFVQTISSTDNKTDLLENPKLQLLTSIHFFDTILSNQLSGENFNRLLFIMKDDKFSIESLPLSCGTYYPCNFKFYSILLSEECINSKNCTNDQIIYYFKNYSFIEQNKNDRNNITLSLEENNLVIRKNLLILVYAEQINMDFIYSTILRIFYEYNSPLMEIEFILIDKDVINISFVFFSSFFFFILKFYKFLY